MSYYIEHKVSGRHVLLSLLLGGALLVAHTAYDLITVSGVANDVNNTSRHFSSVRSDLDSLRSMLGAAGQYEKHPTLYIESATVQREYFLRWLEETQAASQTTRRLQARLEELSLAMGANYNWSLTIDRVDKKLLGYYQSARNALDVLNTERPNSVNPSVVAYRAENTEGSLYKLMLSLDNISHELVSLERGGMDELHKNNQISFTFIWVSALFFLILLAALGQYLYRQSRRDLVSMEFIASSQVLRHLLSSDNFEADSERVVSSGFSTGQYAMAYIQLDRFDVTKGPRYGPIAEGYLDAVSAALLIGLPDGSVLTRADGGRFCCLLPFTMHSQLEKDLFCLMESIRSVDLGWIDSALALSSTASVGIAVLDREAFNMQYYRSQCETACFLAKANGGDQYFIYNDDTANNLEHDLHSKLGELEELA